MHVCMRYAHLCAYFIFIFYFERKKKKNNLPTSKSCNLVKEKKLTALEKLSANFMSVVLPVYIYTYLTYITSIYTVLYS